MRGTVMDELFWNGLDSKKVEQKLRSLADEFDTAGRRMIILGRIGKWLETKEGDLNTEAKARSMPSEEFVVMLLDRALLAYQRTRAER
jgi:hypothetical protein